MHDIFSPCNMIFFPLNVGEFCFGCGCVHAIFLAQVYLQDTFFFSKSSTPPSELEWSTPKYTFFLFQVNENKQVRQTLHNNNGEREIECLNETNYVNIINISKNNNG